MYNIDTSSDMNSFKHDNYGKIKSIIKGVIRFNGLVITKCLFFKRIVKPCRWSFHKHHTFS